MVALRALAFAAVIVAPTAAHADDVARWRPFTTAAGARFGLPVAWIEQVMRAESGGRLTIDGRPIVSRAGAMGLMQLMPGTWADMRAAWKLGSDPFDPHDNIVAGAAFLRQMYDRFGYPGLFGAYNAGPVRYAEHRSTGRPLPRETREYVATVTTGLGRSDVAETPRKGSLFVVLNRRLARSSLIVAPIRPVTSTGLFAIAHRP